jgi:hypothetical protein
MNLMKPVKTGLGRIGTAALALFCCVIVIKGWAEIGKEESAAMADAVLIGFAEQFEPLERPRVVFRHDRHTDALKSYEKGCVTCHLKEGDKLSLKFKRAEDENRQFLMDTYHENCIGCHREMSGKNQDSGPVTCGECHRETVPVFLDRDPMGFDNSLHSRHAGAAGNKCETCHHEYDKAAKKTVYAKGKEGSCRYCHQQDDRDTGMRFQTAAHLACIDCHMKKTEEKKTAGPVQCRGCHDPAEKENIIKMDEVSRLDRKQPDIRFVRRHPGEKKLPASDYRMPLVPFDHQQHEKQETTCRVCHHAGLESCNTCHGMEGSEKGNWVKLERAMHYPDGKMSCTGCHAAMTREKQCAGCHRVSAGKDNDDDAYCGRCHLGAIGENRNPAAVLSDNALAEQLLKKNKTSHKSPDKLKIPETVTIKVLEDAYKPVNFPHGKIVSALWEGAAKSRLADYFHNGADRMCRGCHHNSPVSEKPPRCGTCHGKPFNEESPLVPGLMGAYHQQCMGCHEKMEMAKPAATDCAACHEEKN